jgi:hypothetical protein
MNRIVWQRLGRYLRTGDMIALGILAGRAVRVVQLDHVMIMGRPLSWPDPELERLRASRRDLRTRFALPADLDRLKAIFPHYAGEYAGRMQQGDRCLLLEKGSGTVAFTWLKLSPQVVIKEIGFEVTLPPRAAWGYDTFVVMEARRAGAFAVLMYEVLEELRRQAIPSLFATITHTNPESFHAHARLQYQVVMTLSRLQLPGGGVYRSRPQGGRALYAATASGAPRLTIVAPSRP